MFFFYFDINEATIVKKCIEIYFNDKIGTNGYCDVSELFSDSVNKNTLKNSFNTNQTELINLYDHKYPKTKDDLKIIIETFIDKNYTNIDAYEAYAILFWCFKIFKGEMKFEKQEDVIMDDFMKYLREDLDLSSYNRHNTIIYDTALVDFHVINSVSSLLTILNTFPNNKELFYRGHSKASYKLRPSILRTNTLIKNEKQIYQELMINCPEDFKNAFNHIDYLVKMQHYGLPTRLLDITKNPLVALYFACCSNEKSTGEIIIFSPHKNKIKYENSDTITMLSSLPLFSYEDQINLMDYLYTKKGNPEIAERFLHEVRTEKSSFTDRIKSSDMENCFVVLPKKDNNRIMKQDGAFIICGINNHPEIKINDELRLISEEKMVLVLVENKQKILNELDLLSINKSTLFPEIDSVSDYIKSKYND